MAHPEKRSAASCQPFLRWAGSKRKLIPILRSYWRDDHQRYIEPFAGSACLFFAIAPARAILGDLNSELIKTYLEVKYRLEPVMEELRDLGHGDKESYLFLRGSDPSEMTPARRAARFLYLNRFCFNGIYRTNQKGHFNVPFSGDGCGRTLSVDAFRICAKHLQGARLMNDDFESVLAHARAGDLVYMDPPYATNSKRVFREYHPDAFTPSDVTRLRLWLERLNSAGIEFVVSYAESPEAETLKAGFNFEKVHVRRNVAGFAAHRKVSTELLITNIQRKD